MAKETNKERSVIYRDDAINALNECIDIKGFAYTSMHDAIMELPEAREDENDTPQRDLCQDLATGKESILSIAIKGKLEKRKPRADCPWK